MEHCAPAPAFHQIADARLWHGDCMDMLRALIHEGTAVDAVVTDPPYGLKLMGKRWDRGIPGCEFWAAALEAAKPGAHLVAFGGTRTYHRLACAIEDAGWIIRDGLLELIDVAPAARTFMDTLSPDQVELMAQTWPAELLAWVYGNGWPKSRDVSKAIDALDAVAARRTRNLEFTAWMRSTGVTAQAINEATRSHMGGHYLTDGEQPAVPTEAMFAKFSHLVPDPPAAIRELIHERTVESENLAAREVIGRSAHGFGPSSGQFAHGKAANPPVTAPATDLAQQWAGWGSTLKPAWEPIILARKPLAGSLAENVIRHGPGALNIDGCLVYADDYGGQAYTTKRMAPGASVDASGDWRPDSGESFEGHTKPGRWPANVLTDGSEAVAGAFPEAPGAVSDVRGTEPSAPTDNVYGEFSRTVGAVARKDGGGSAARFFYSAKATKADRDEMFKRKVRNTHPTVKPTDLMRYLCRLVTPPRGLVCDMFMGSGSTGKACGLEGFGFVGAEISGQSFEIARERIRAAFAQGQLF